MSVTSDVWIRRYLAEHPDTEHLRASSLKYTGKHAYIHCWFQRSCPWQLIATLINHNGQRMMLLHNPYWNEESVNDRFYHSAQPLWGPWWYREHLHIEYPPIIRVEYHTGDDFTGKSDAEIVDTMRERYETRIAKFHERRELLRQRRVRWQARKVIEDYELFVQELCNNVVPVNIRDMCRELMRDSENTPENRRMWASSAAKAGARSRIANADVRAEQRRKRADAALAFNEFTEWLADQPWYVPWELANILSERSMERSSERFPEVGGFEERIGIVGLRNLLSVFRRNSIGRRPYNAFITAFMDSWYTSGPTIFCEWEDTWHHERWALPPENRIETIDRIIEGLMGKPLPAFPNGVFDGRHTWRTNVFGNSLWIAQRTDGHTADTHQAYQTMKLNALNRGYLIERLKHLKQKLEMPQQEEEEACV